MLEAYSIVLFIFVFMLVVCVPFFVFGDANEDWQGITVCVTVWVCVVSMITISIIIPASRVANRGDVWKAEEYYNNIIVPNIVEEYDDYVVVEGVEGAIWQAGDYTLQKYNSFLRNQRHWEDMFIIGGFKHEAPEYLKTVELLDNN